VHGVHDVPWCQTLGAHHGLRQHYQQTITAPRNRYMHQADTIPTNTQAEDVLNEMHACISSNDQNLWMALGRVT
jgi:hypothetical protein